MNKTRKLLHELLEKAKNNLKQSGTGSLAPVLVVHGERQVDLVVMNTQAKSAEERRELLHGLGRRFAHRRPVRVTAIWDGYLKQAPATSSLKEALPFPSLADDPEATDAIIIATLDRRGRSDSIVCLYVRRISLEKGLVIEFKDPMPLKGGKMYTLEAFFEGVESYEKMLRTLKIKSDVELQSSLSMARYIGRNLDRSSPYRNDLAQMIRAVRGEIRKRRD